MTILFLCTGNTCRSPMAAALFALHCAMRGIDGVKILSAGTGAWPGSPAEPNAVAAAAELGADCATHRSRMATPALLAEADVVVCLAAGHAKQAAPFLPIEKLRVLGGGIADPYGGDLALYRACAAKIDAALPALLPDIFCKAQIVPAEEAHLPALAALEREAFPAHPASQAVLRGKLALQTNYMYSAIFTPPGLRPPPSGRGGLSMPLAEDEMVTSKSPPLAEGGGSKSRGVLGFIGVDEISGEAFVDDLAVFGQHRRQGIASALLARAETCAILRGCEKIHIEARESNAPARALYENRGCKVVGRRKNYYENPREDAILMTMEIV